MKRIIALSAVFVASLLPGLARADHHEVFIHGIQKLSANSCAVELWINAPAQNGFEGVDRITVDGTLLVSLGDAAAAAIDGGGNVNVGDSVLFASSSFESENGLTPDASFPDASCAALGPGVDVSFVLDDVAFGGPNTVIDTVTTSASFGGANTAMAKTSESATPTFVDLTANNVQVANNDGLAVTLGKTGATKGTGGCSLIR